jgi:aspartyl-tRNA synthetase
MELDFLAGLQRTHRCGELRAADAGKTVTLMGWVNRRRDLGGLIFIDLRDRTGQTQIMFDTDNAAVHEKAADLRSEFVIAVTGTVKLRDEKTRNKNLPTGDIELIATELRLLNKSELPPFLPSEQNANVNEETRLKYRYIDLRRSDMQANLELRHKVAIAIRKNLNDQGFLEIETPYLTRSTPEGARDYLVPSRVHAGEFYALPQSPQIFKQILMISGFDRYFQIVRCFRDEDLRADRQPEFTQIDLEMCFPTEDAVFSVVEGFLKASWETAGFEFSAPFPRMSYDDAIRNYGIDKPDLRLPAMTDVADAFTAEIKQTLGIEPGLPIVAIRIPNVGELSRKERDEHKTLLQPRQAQNIKFFDDFKRLEKSWPELVTKVRELVKPSEGDLTVIVAGHQSTANAEPRRLRRMRTEVYQGAGLLRLAFAQKYAARHKAFERGNWKFLWVTDFPMFEWDEQDARWNAAHHPFTSPHEEDMSKLGGGLAAARDVNSALGEMRSRAYDVVLNGMELGSGSIRIHQQPIQSKIFEALGMDDEEQKRRFGFFREALRYGTPPHGGIALGLDRIVMLLAGAPSLREVIPFPKTAAATDLMTDAPTPVTDAQLKELSIGIKKS